MIWNKYTIKTTTKDADLVSAVLMDYGINDIQIDNNVQLTDEELNRMYADFVKELPPDDGTCFINFYVEFDEDEEANAGIRRKMHEVAEGLREAEQTFGLDPLEFSTDVINSQDWENNWKQYFKPFLVDDILIKPTWEELPADGGFQTVIEIDPGMAFGTGMHETTRLCLRGLRKYMQGGARVLDLGTGSGILSIAALKLGAAEAAAVDIDPQAVAVAEENFAVNGLPADRYTLYTGNILEDESFKAQISSAPGDLVLANILAEVIIPLASEVDKYMKPGAVFVSSGIIDDKEAKVVEAVRANPHLELLEVAHDGDWVSVCAKRN